MALCNDFEPLGINMPDATIPEASGLLFSSSIASSLVEVLLGPERMPDRGPTVVL